MKAVLRTFAGILSGLLVLFFLLIAVELFSAIVHPFPADFKGTTLEICAHVERYPAWVLAVVVPLWAATAFVSTAIARKISSVYSAVIVGGLLLAALVCNLSMLPYPLWFKGTNLLTIPIAVFIGSRGSIRRMVTVATNGH